MSTASEVLDVVQNWSGRRPAKGSQVLEDWWNQTAPGSSHSSLPFDPDGIQDLVTLIERAFPDTEPIDTGDLGSSGSIKTVQDLLNAINEPAPTKALTARVAAKKQATLAKRAAPAKKAAKEAAPGVKAAVKKSDAANKRTGAAQKAAKKSSGKDKKNRR